MTTMTAGVVDPNTGELVSLMDINLRMIRLADELESSSAALDKLLREQAQVVLSYDLHYAATITASDAKSEDRRKAEATTACSLQLLPSGESLARARARLEVQVRAVRDAQHNLRALMSGLQTVSANVRSEATALGMGTS